MEGGGGATIIRIIVFWGLYWGPPILANYHIGCRGFRASVVHSSCIGVI